MIELRFGQLGDKLLIKLFHAEDYHRPKSEFHIIIQRLQKSLSNLFLFDLYHTVVL